MQQDIEGNGTTHLDIELGYDKSHDVTYSSHTHNDEKNQNNEIYQIRSHWHDNTQNQCMFDLDQVVHTLPSSSALAQQKLDTVNESPVSENTFIERSSDTGTLFPLQVSLPAVSDLPGFEDLDQTGDSPPIMPDDHTQQWTTSMPTDGPTTWYTPPQTPPSDDPEICAMEPSLELPPESLYVLGTIAKQMTPMLVDTGASVTAVSYSFFSTLLPSPTMQTTLLTSIRTVSGEELPILGQATLSFTFDATPYSFSVLVIDNLTYPVILGRDFLTHFGSVIP